MDAAVKAKLSRALWFITGAAALCVGLGAMHVNVVGMLHLEGFDHMLRYLVGIAGLASLVIFFKECSTGKC
jgi:uncharacterized membrane protein YuzA (DUF378 family)